MRLFFQKIFFLLLCAVAIFSCQDGTDTLGSDMMPNEDLTTHQFKSYPVQMQSFLVDSLLSRTQYSYLGKYVDPETNTSIKCDFLAQYNIVEGLKLFPDSVKDNKINRVQINLLVNNYVGDKTSSFKLSIYDLDTLINSNQDFYTSLDPMRYIDDEHGAKPIATKWYTIEDYTVSEDDRWDDAYQRSIRIVLDDAELGQKIYDAYRRSPELFRNTYSWVRSGLPFSKGMYFKLEYGDGAVAEISSTQVCLFFDYFDQQSSKITPGVLRLASTEEVIQATSFDNDKNALKELAENSLEYSYLKTPAGLFTEVTLPIEELSHNDTISLASMTFTRTFRQQSEAISIGIPQNLLLVRYDDYRTVVNGKVSGFFERNNLPDDRTSYIAAFNSSTNSYTYNNIARLVSLCIKEKRDGTASPNYNKVLLIPVTVTMDNSKNIVMVNHDFSLGSARLMGGKNKVGAWMNVMYSGYDVK